MNDVLLSKINKDIVDIPKIISDVSSGAVTTINATEFIRKKISDEFEILSWKKNLENVASVADLVFCKLYPDSAGAKVLMLDPILEKPITDHPELDETTMLLRGVHLLVSYIERHKKNTQIEDGCKKIIKYLEDGGYAPDLSNVVLE
jgi:hypothetical protein